MKLDRKKFELCLAKSGYLISNIVDISGITRASISIALNGTRNTRPQTIGKIAKALGVPVEEIIMKEGD